MPALKQKPRKSRCFTDSCAEPFFFTFGIAAIFVNAANRAAQEFKDQEHETTMAQVLKSVNHIQDALSPSAAQMTEAERQRHLLDSLRDQYILEQKYVDPEIVAGTKMPPDDWLNARLTQLGEKLRVKEGLAPTSASHYLEKPPQLARIVFGFYSPNFSGDHLEKLRFDSIINNTATFDVAFENIGTVPAQNLQVFARICPSCEWVSTPQNFVETNPDHPFDRDLVVPMPWVPNLASQKLTFVVRIPQHRPRFTGTQLQLYYLCTNCGVVDWAKPQLLTVSSALGEMTKQLFPSVSYIPARAH